MSTSAVLDNHQVIDESLLPGGWTLSRVRSLEPSAELLDPNTHYVVADQRPTSTNLDVLMPTAILSFSGLCLCLVHEDDGEPEWWMGQLEESDGSIVCWSSYGSALADAIGAL